MSLNRVMMIGNLGQDPEIRDTPSDLRLKTKDLIEQLNPVLRGWGHYYKRAHVRTLFNKLDHWIERRIWSHRYKRWRNCGWEQLPKRKLYGEYGLVQLVKLIPSIAAQQHAPS